MGWDGKQGIGAKGDGISQPIEVDERHDRRGLGVEVEKKEKIQHEINLDTEVKIEQKPIWLTKPNLEKYTTLDFENFKKNIVRGPVRF